MKLTGACTLLSNALSSEASPGTPLRHCPPVPGLTTLPAPASPTPPGLATDPTRGVPEEVGTAPCPGTWPRGQEEGSGVPVHHHPHQSCSQSGSIMCQPVLLQLVHVSSWPSGEEVKRSMEMRPRAWQRLCCHQAQSALGPDDATGPQTLPATWNKLSLASESLGKREEVAERKSLAYQGRERGYASPAVSPSVLCELTPDVMPHQPLQLPTGPSCQQAHGAIWTRAKQDKGHEQRSGLGTAGSPGLPAQK